MFSWGVWLEACWTCAINIRLRPHTHTHIYTYSLLSHYIVIQQETYSFALTFPSFRFRSSKYSLTLVRATSTTSVSSTVGGTFTAASYFPCTPFSTNSRRTRRSVLPLRVLGIMPRPWIIPPNDAMAPIWSRTRWLMESNNS